MTAPVIALCLGGARTVWRDLEAAGALLGNRPSIIVACNYAGQQYQGRLDAWASLHPERLGAWMETRAERGGNTNYRAFSHRPRRGLTAEILPWRWFGASGLYTAQVALDRMGCAGAILCGVPMDDTGGHIHWPGEWDNAFHYRRGLEEIPDSDRAHLRSMSGFTQSLFDAPDAEWLDGLAQDGHDQTGKAAA